ncbi:MAG: hypothetical protein ACJA1R_002033 [Flavobacteriales bacterium]
MRPPPLVQAWPAVSFRELPPKRAHMLCNPCGCVSGLADWRDLVHRLLTAEGQLKGVDKRRDLVTLYGDLVDHRRVAQGRAAQLEARAIFQSARHTLGRRRQREAGAVTHDRKLHVTKIAVHRARHGFRCQRFKLFDEAVGVFPSATE